MKNEMSTLYELTRKFNNISGSSSELNEKHFIEQYTYIKEEFKELAETVGDKYLAEDSTNVKWLTLEPQMLTSTLDDCIDILITTFGFLQKLENLGVDVGQAAIDTAMNKLSKYPTSPAVAHQTVEKVKIEKAIEAVATFNEEHGVYVIRNKHTGKVCKPIDFISNDLNSYITQQVKENYAAAN